MDSYKIYSDEQLVELLKSGDEAAFTVIYETYRNKIYSYALRLTKSEQEANDIVQNVFLTIWKSRKKLSEVSNLAGYITIIARNEFFRIYKEKIKLKKIRLAVEKSFGQLTSVNIISDLTAKEQARIIASAINDLSPQQKMVYELSRSKGMKLEQIADHLDISVNTVKVHLTRALSTLRIKLKNHSDLAIIIFLFLL